MKAILPKDIQLPSIRPVPAGIRRPLWSVMIPTYNCAHFLGKTLHSVLGQDPGEDMMEIVVVDDVSTKDNPAEVVSKMGSNRIRFQRNSRNLGAIANFNRCVELATGELIHILHGDDFVLPGFYDVIGRMAEQNPQCSFFATRAIAIDKDGVPEWMSGRIKSLEQTSKDVSEVVMSQQFQTASVVVRRSFYERHGGFDTELVHCADWEMWVRAIRLGGGLVHPEPLARYRMFDGNDSSRLVRTGENVRDRFRLTERFDGLPGFNRRRFVEGCANLALTQAKRLASKGDTEAVSANLHIYRMIETLPKRLIRTARASVRRGAQFIGIW